MAELATVARPYAEATFQTALQKNMLGAVGEGLALVAAIAADEQMRSILGDPKVNAQQKKQLFDAIAGERADPTVKSLLAVLVDNRREVLIGEIARQFDDLKHEHERVLRARITSAQPLSDQQRNDIVAALEQRYGKKI